MLLLEDCDKYLMRSLFNVEMGTPIESFFIKTSTFPLRFVLHGRRIMYYWMLFQKGKEELVKQVFEAMREFSVNSVWYSQVKEYFITCDIQLSEEAISTMSKFQFKKLVDSKVKEKSTEYLTELQLKHSKSLYLHQGPKMQAYLTTNQLSIIQKQLLVKLRSGMTPNKANFRKN